jgi:hypothetical protein
MHLPSTLCARHLPPSCVIEIMKAKRSADMLNALFLTLALLVLTVAGPTVAGPSQNSNGKETTQMNDRDSSAATAPSQNNPHAHAKATITVHSSEAKPFDNRRPGIIGDSPQRNFRRRYRRRINGSGSRGPPLRPLRQPRQHATIPRKTRWTPGHFCASGFRNRRERQNQSNMVRRSRFRDRRSFWPTRRGRL